MFYYLLFIAGFIILLKGADLLVDGSSSIAKKLNIPTLVIGLTIVAFGTSAPELMVNILASIRGSADIAIGNIVGSNIANVLLILGVAAAIYPIEISKGTAWKEIPFNLLAVMVLAFMANDLLIDHRHFSELSRIDGLLLLSFFVIFIYYTFGIGKVEGKREMIEEYSLKRSFMYILLGIIGLGFGGKWIVDGATYIAQNLGVSEGFIGLSVVALGTSLPELATSAVAAHKKRSGIAIGNIVGSNIFNILWILGLSATIKPINFSVTLNYDILICFLVTLLLFAFVFIGRKRVIERWQGIMFLISYVIYIIFLIVRG